MPLTIVLSGKSHPQPEKLATKFCRQSVGWHQSLCEIAVLLNRYCASLLNAPTHLGMSLVMPVSLHRQLEETSN